jgi:hypothetical protein
LIRSNPYIEHLFIIRIERTYAYPPQPNQPGENNRLRYDFKRAKPFSLAHILGHDVYLHPRYAIIATEKACQGAQRRRRENRNTKKTDNDKRGISRLLFVLSDAHIEEVRDKEKKKRAEQLPLPFMRRWTAAKAQRADDCAKATRTWGR